MRDLRAHLLVFVALYAPTVAFMARALAAMSPSDRREMPTLIAPFVFVAGPFAGVALRGLANARFSGPLAAIAGAALLAAVMAQAAWPTTRAGQVAQLAAWAAGLLAWFGAAFLSSMLAFG